MTNKAMKYGLMTIAVALLVALAFAGTASAVEITANEWNALGSDSALINGNASYEFTGPDIIYPKFNGSEGYDVTRNITFDFTNYTGTFYGEPIGSTVYNGALFGHIKNTSYSGTITIKNLTLTSVKVMPTGSTIKYGGIVGYFEGAGSTISMLNFKNCTLVNCSIGSASGSDYVGGLVGYAWSVSVNVVECNAKHCDVLSTTINVGGLVGRADDVSFTECNIANCTVASTGNGDVGGLIGRANNASFEKCGVENTSVYAGASGVGGLIGYADSTIKKIGNSTVKNCVIASGSSYVGGLVGAAMSAASKIGNCHVLNCTIAGKSSVGGLVGYAGSASPTSERNSVEYCAVNGIGDLGVTLVWGSMLNDLNCDAELSTNLIYNYSVSTSPRYEDTITLYNVTTEDEKQPLTSLDSKVAGTTFWKTIFNATGSKAGSGHTQQVTYLGMYGEVGGYGVGSAPTLTYNKNSATSGSVPASKLYGTGSRVTVPDKGNLAKTGYKFLGWYNESTGLLGEGDTFYITDDVTLFANWSIIEYNITYNNITSATNPETNPSTYTITSSEIILDNAYKMGYTFENWYNSTEFTEAYENNTIPAGSIGDKVFYANWTVNTTDLKASGNKAVFGNDNVTAIHSTSGTVTKVLLKDVSNVTDTAVNFTADNTSVGEIPDITGYLKDEITIFDLNATAYGTAKINVTVTFANESTANAKKDNVSFFHYVGTEWEQLNSTIVGVNNANVTYTVETTSFSPFGIGIYTPITYTVRFDANGGQGSMADMTFTYDEEPCVLSANIFQRYNSNFLYWTTADGTRYNDKQLVQNLTTIDGATVVMKAEWEGYSTGGSSSGSTYLGSNSASYTPTPQPTVKPTVAPTTAPTEKPATPTVIATEKPTTQATQQSPEPFIGILAGLGATGLLLRIRR